MNTISKLLVATALVASFAAPALAIDYNSENFPAAERTVAAIAPVQTNGTAWAQSYAMDNTAWSAQAAQPVRGADHINGGM